ncbi:MAG: hypothetical protein ACYCW6_15315 [Candidatus Xenobia bacterium]
MSLLPESSTPTLMGSGEIPPVQVARRIQLVRLRRPSYHSLSGLRRPHPGSACQTELPAARLRRLHPASVAA